MKNLKNNLSRKSGLFFANQLVYLLSSLLLISTSCKEIDKLFPEHNSRAKTHYGPAKSFGGGVARSWIKTDKSGKPTAVGVSISDKALAEPPEAHDHGGHMTYESILPFPKVEGQDLYTYVALYWNPNGHEPETIYDKPHFDVHFYMIPDEDRKNIPGLPLDQMDPEPAEPQYVPQDYVMIPGRIPAMGSHFVDVTSPELNGEPFTQTFIYGSYQKEIIFLEPMITLEYLLSKPQATIPVKQPAAFQRSGYYPKSYHIEHDARKKEHQIYLSDLTLQQAQ